MEIKGRYFLQVQSGAALCVVEIEGLLSVLSVL